MTQTYADGHFSFADLPGSHYQLSATLRDFSTGHEVVSIASSHSATISVAFASEKALTFNARHKVHLQPRHAVVAEVGASSYSIGSAAIANQPQSASGGLNQVLLQAPGVAQDSFGQLHVRGDHGDLQ